MTFQMLRGGGEERWKPIIGYEGAYEVSNHGRVRSLPRKVAINGGVKFVPGGLLSPTFCRAGYPRVKLSKRGKKKVIRIHRLVAIAFVPGMRPGLEVCHNDGDKTNSASCNLRWDTSSENNRDRARQGRNPLSARTQCSRGHEYTPENTRWSERDGRTCRECRRQQTRDYKKRRRAAVGKKVA